VDFSAIGIDDGHIAITAVLQHDKPTLKSPSVKQAAEPDTNLGETVQRTSLADSAIFMPQFKEVNNEEH
jgi:hypothetical protein